MSAEIDFTSDWAEGVRGSLTPGSRFKINYDSTRLPENRDSRYGQPAWSIVAYVKFLEDSSGESKALRSDGGSMMTAEFDIPNNADRVILWFVNSGASGGGTYYDSDYGQNYQFTI